MLSIGQVEKRIYGLRKEHPLVIPQIDPDNHDKKSAKRWLDNVKSVDISLIALGGSMLDPKPTQTILDMALEYGFLVNLYLTNDTGYLKGKSGKTAIYWAQVPHAQNSFYSWDGLITNSLHIKDSGIEPIPTVYVFDEREFRGTSNWITRGYPIPENKPFVSLSVAKAAEYLGIRFYIMAGGSGSPKPPPIEHLKLIKKETQLFVIPTSGIKTQENVKSLFSEGADAIHVGNVIEKPDGLKIIEEMVKISKQYPGKSFLHEE